MSESNSRERFKLLSLRFEDKRDFSPLQAADVLAYEMYRHLPRYVGLDKRAARVELGHLLPDDDHAIRRWGFLNEGELAQWAQISKKAWEHHGKKPLGQDADKLRRKARRIRP